MYYCEASGQDLKYFDQEKDEKFIPHIIESSIGVGRLFLAVICDAYEEEEVNGDIRVVLKLSKKIAPIKIAILPLSKKDELVKGTKEIFDILSEDFRCQMDVTQSIGKRYRRQDEIGTPYCITYDFESLEDNAVTVRDRDTMKQERVKIEDLQNHMMELFREVKILK